MGEQEKEIAVEVEEVGDWSRDRKRMKEAGNNTFVWRHFKALLLPAVTFPRSPSPAQEDSPSLSLALSRSLSLARSLLRARASSPSVRLPSVQHPPVQQEGWMTSR